MFNRKYKINCLGNTSLNNSNEVLSSKEYKFYNKRLLHIYKTLLLVKQSQSHTINLETTEYINHIPLDLIDLGNKFIEESILFFKREDKNEIIQNELCENNEKEEEIVEGDCGSLTEMMENTNIIDKRFYHSGDTSGRGKFRIIDEGDGDFNNPKQRQYHLRDNSLRLKGITKNNNMSILYEQDETKDTQTEQYDGRI